MKSMLHTLVTAGTFLASVSGGWGQNLMSNQLNNTANTFKNTGMPQEYSKQYEALAKLRDPGMRGSTTSPLDAQMMQQANQAIMDTQRRIDEINAQARRQMRQDSQGIRRAGDQAANNITNQALQGLSNLDAIDRAEAGAGRSQPRRTGNSPPPDQDLTGYNKQRSDVLKDISLDEALRTLDDQYSLWNMINGPQQDTFEPGTATSDIPNAFTSPLDGQPVTFTKDGDGSNIIGMIQPLEGTNGGVIDSVPQAVPNTTGTGTAPESAKCPWNDLGYLSKFDMGKDYVRMNDDLRDQSQIWSGPDRQEKLSKIVQLEAMITRNQATQKALNDPDVTNVEAYGMVAGASMLQDGVIDTAFKEGGYIPGPVGAAFKTADVLKSAGDAALGIVTDGLTPGSTLDVAETGVKAAGDKLPGSVSPTIDGLKAINKLEESLKNGSLPNIENIKDVVNTAVGYGGVGKMAKGVDIVTDASKLGGTVQDLRATAEASGMDLKMRLGQEKKKLDDLTRNTAQSLHDKRAKVEAIKRSDPDFAKQLDGLSYRPTKP